MDQSKVGKVGAPSHTPATSAPREANATLKSRFLRAMEQPSPQSNKYKPESTGVPLHALLTMANAHAKASTSPTHTPDKARAQADLSTLLERTCSEMYVGHSASQGQRVILSLDPVLTGAAAEIVRDGAHLSIKLHARSDSAYRSLSSQRETLIKSLQSARDRTVKVEVVRIDMTQGNRAVLADG